MTITPVTLREARTYVDAVHRHRRAPQGGLFAIGVSDGASIIGVVIVAGFKLVGSVKGRSWDTPSRPRVDTHPTQDKIRWEVIA